jgi:hypothetical protein
MKNHRADGQNQFRKQDEAATSPLISATVAQAGVGPLACVSLSSRSTECGPAKVKFPRGWQGERMRILLRHCRVIDREQAKEHGRSVEATCRLLSSRWRKRTYRTAPHTRVRLSAQTIHRVYYAWRKSERLTSALALRYKNARVKVTLSAKQKARAIRMLSNAQTISFTQIYRALFPRGSRVSLDRFYEKFPADFRSRARLIFRARQRHQRAEAAFKVITERIAP